MPEPLYADANDLEGLTGTRASTWRYWDSCGGGPEGFPVSIKIGRRRLWKREAVMAWLADQEAQAEADALAASEKQQRRMTRRDDLDRWLARYGKPHRALRAHLLGHITIGQLCPRCHGLLIPPEFETDCGVYEFPLGWLTQNIHLDHADGSDTEYLGLTHAACNRCARSPRRPKVQTQTGIKRISIAESARRLCVSKRTVRRLISSGELRAYRIGKAGSLIRVDSDEVAALLNPVIPNGKS